MKNDLYIIVAKTGCHVFGKFINLRIMKGRVINENNTS
nr:MAG TPA: hypothetical protein [Caudoviricetes sp.]